MYLNKFSFWAVIIVGTFGACMLIINTERLGEMQREAVKRNYGVMTNGHFQWK